MDEELPVEERSARVVRKPGEPTSEERSAHEGTHLPLRDWCPHCVSCTASAQIDNQCASEKMIMEISAEQAVTAGPVATIFMKTFCGRGAVAATQCSLTWQRASWGSLRLGISDQELWC